MSNDDSNRMMNMKASQRRPPRTPAEVEGAWQAIIDRPPLEDGDEQYNRERLWFIDNWLYATELVLNRQAAEQNSRATEPPAASTSPWMRILHYWIRRCWTKVSFWL